MKKKVFSELSSEVKELSYLYFLLSYKTTRSFKSKLFVQTERKNENLYSFRVLAQFLASQGINNKPSSGSWSDVDKERLLLSLLIWAQHEPETIGYRRIAEFRLTFHANRECLSSKKRQNSRSIYAKIFLLRLSRQLFVMWRRVEFGKVASKKGLTGVKKVSVSGIIMEISILFSQLNPFSEASLKFIFSRVLSDEISLLNGLEPEIRFA